MPPLLNVTIKGDMKLTDGEVRSPLSPSVAHRESPSSLVQLLTFPVSFPPLFVVQVANSNIIAGVASLLVRLVAGPLCDRFGPVSLSSESRRLKTIKADPL
jgi:NNP family nitrate/nitrite transporter-like MFS transporter